MASFPNLLVREVDGCDPLASLSALTEAAAWCRARQGPALVHAHVIRPYSHSLSDDEALYRAASEREADAARDPLLLSRGASWRRASPARPARRAAEDVDREVAEAADKALGRRLLPRTAPRSTSTRPR